MLNGIAFSPDETKLYVGDSAGTTDKSASSQLTDNTFPVATCFVDNQEWGADGVRWMRWATSTPVAATESIFSLTGYYLAKF